MELRVHAVGEHRVFYVAIDTLVDMLARAGVRVKVETKSAPPRRRGVA